MQQLHHFERVDMGPCLSHNREKTDIADSDVESIQQVLGEAFTTKEIKEMYEHFVAEYPSGKINVEQLAEVYRFYYPDGNPDLFAQRMFEHFDTNQDKAIDHREFIIGLSLMHKSSVDVKLRWIFSLYDEDKSGYISRDEMLNLFKIVDKMIPLKNTTPELRTSYLFDQMDKNRDDKICLDEFIVAVQKNNALVYPIPFKEK